MDFIRRARALQPADPAIELTAAELLSLGEYDDEARRSLERFRRLVSSDDQRFTDRAARGGEALAERPRSGERGHSFTHASVDDIAGAVDAQRVGELLAEIDESPNSWRLYAALVTEMVLGGRMDEAIDWADRCVSRCLGRSEQISARGLAIETRGLHALAVESPRAAKLYAAGAYEPTRRALEALRAADSPFDFSLLYLLGRCQLETGAPEAASASFRGGYDLCGQSIYRPVLRGLTEDIDQAYLPVARGTVESRIKEGDFNEAIAESCRVLSRLKKPEAWLVEMARIFCGVALERLRSEKSAATIPDVDVSASWRRRCRRAMMSIARSRSRSSHSRSIPPWRHARGGSSSAQRRCAFTWTPRQRSTGSQSC